MISRRAALTGVGVAAASLALGKVTAFANALPSRIVSVGGAVTETLFALGAGDRVLAIDTTSTFPEATKALPKIGYVRQLSAEGVLAMEPDMVLLSGEAGPAAAVAQLQTSGVPITQTEIIRSASGVADMIETVGNAVGAGGKAKTLAAGIRADFDALAGLLPATDRKKILLILSAGTGPVLGAGANTAASTLIHLGGGALAFPNMEGYKAISLEPVLAAAPDWIVLPSHVMMALGGPAQIAKLDLIAGTPAGREGRVAIIDSHYLLGFGPRAPQAAADLASLLYPDLAIPLLGRDGRPSSNVVRLGAQ